MVSHPLEAVLFTDVEVQDVHLREKSVQRERPLCLRNRDVDWILKDPFLLIAHKRRECLSVLGRYHDVRHVLLRLYPRLFLHP